MLRLFAGIPLPPEQKLTLSTICMGVPGVRWTDPGNYHVTLRFIGEVDEGDAMDIDEALLAIRAPKFQLSIAGLGIFGAPGKPRVLYAGLDREPRLVQLRDRIEAAMGRIGLEPDTRRYTPHVTLGSCKAPNPVEVQRFVEANNLVRLPPFEVADFHLIRSYLTKAGSIYEEVAEYRLG